MRPISALVANKARCTPHIVDHCDTRRTRPGEPIEIRGIRNSDTMDK
jgi:hypothetical protein